MDTVARDRREVTSQLVQHTVSGCQHVQHVGEQKITDAQGSRVMQRRNTIEIHAQVLQKFDV